MSDASGINVQGQWGSIVVYTPFIVVAMSWRNGSPYSSLTSPRFAVEPQMYYSDVIYLNQLRCSRHLFTHIWKWFVHSLLPRSCLERPSKPVTQLDFIQEFFKWILFLSSLIRRNLCLKFWTFPVFAPCRDQVIQQAKIDVTRWNEQVLF